MIRSRSPIWLVWGATLAGMVLGCSSDRPIDMWIAKDPDAGAGWEVPVREAGEDTATGAAGTGGTGGDSTAGTTGSAGTGAAGTTGAGGDVTGGGGSSAAGAGGNAGNS